MLDTVSHETLQDDLRSHASPWNCMTAEAGIVDQLPDEPGLYMFVWCSAINVYMADSSVRNLHQVLYIGQAGGASHMGNTIKNRFKDYRKYLMGDPEALWAAEPQPRRSNLLTHYLSLHPLEYWYATVLDRSRIANLERRMIELYNPPLNQQNGPRLRVRAQPPQPAFPN